MTGRIRSTRVSADYLHANSTNHTWVFGAFAEFFDNSYDAKAREVQIEVVNLGNHLCLSFQDDGVGMDQEELYNMLSFGFCGRHLSAAIGKYGNGFKSGSMRLGRDAIVFTKNKEMAGVGLLSQTLNKINNNAETLLVPMLNYSLPDLGHDDEESHRENLAAILEYSVFEDEEKLKKQIRQLPRTGTGIIVYNLHRTCDSSYLELDFDTDPQDIRCPDTFDAGHQCSSVYRVSLKEYCSILYLKPRMKIKLRGSYVKTQLIAKSLCNRQLDEYIPRKVSTSSQDEDAYAHRGQRNTIIFGFLPGSAASGNHGMMLYSDNRLIKPYEQVSCQRQGDGVGKGVVGVTQAKFLTPTNTKQDFVRDQKYMSAMKAYNSKLKNYWDNARRAQQSASTSRRSLDSWVQCDYKKCLKWRRLPPGVEPADLPDKWYCHMHPDNISCDLPEDMHEDEDIIEPPSRSRSLAARTAVPTTGRQKRRQNSPLLVVSDSDQSSHSVSALNDAGSSANQNTLAKDLNSSHLRLGKIALLGSSKQKDKKSVSGCSRRKTTIVHSQKDVHVSSRQKSVRVFSRQKTSQVSSTETEYEIVKSAARQVARGARRTTRSNNQGKHQLAISVKASAENQHGPAQQEVDVNDEMIHSEPCDVSNMTDSNEDNVTDTTEPGDDVTDITEPGDDATDITEPGDDVTDMTKPGDDVTDITEPGDDVTGVTEPCDDVTDMTDDTDVPVEAEPRCNDSLSECDDDDVDNAVSCRLQEPGQELAQLQSEFNHLRRRFDTLLNNSKRLLEILVPEIKLDMDIDIEQLIADMVEHGLPHRSQGIHPVNCD